MPKPQFARVDLHKQAARIFFAPQFDEMIPFNLCSSV